ncbi:isoleucine--tRNA ligase [endosymbiont of Rhynchophorus ferrugineus]|uniref:Isoleucine--tRNA ligase n=1 Tax=endosymbiont of Rhynchophorus ferrugineus TaxID=1972133 RepID=A0A2Z5T8S2_9GAMM|nr:isoleucine--tRNA ligase [endosymbiont of Rhynchophorus ferrugineus]
MKNLKLNLPKTKFSMKGNLIEKEKEILNEWENINIYYFITKKNKNNKKKFLLHDGPPYANGNIHIGNILNKIIKDIILKSKRLSGFNCEYIPGWDCHGLPIELKVFKNKININNISDDFKNILIEKCRKYVNIQIDNQKKSFIKLGIITNWNKYYYTMNFEYQYNILKCFSELYKLGYIKLKYKPVYWCIECKSTISEFEISYKEINSNTLYFYFNVYKDMNFYNKKNVFKNKSFNYNVLIWTTTLWTIFDNEAISINPNILYNIIKINNNYLIISKSSLNNLKNKIFKDKYNIIEEFLGLYLLDIKVFNSISNKIIKIIFDNNIVENFGTGIVHIAPGHGIEDYELGIKNNLNIKNSIDELGIYNENICVKELYKNNIFKSNNKIIEFLKKINIYFFNLNIYHNYPFCNRHNQKIIFRSIFQWFIDLNHKNLKKKCIDNIKNVNFIPNWGKNNIIKMLINRDYWCISRQRIWGVPIAVFINENNIPHPKTYIFLKKICKLIRNNGSEIWNKIKIKDFNIDDKIYKKNKDVLDVWFDSGISFINYIKKYNKKINEYDLCVEGIDQFRGWFISSLIIFFALHNKIPYKNVLIHKFILNNNGIKISKSLNNYNNLNINNYPSDIIRLYISSNNYKKDIFFNENSINNIVELYKKIRNVIKFIISNIEDVKKNKIIKNENNLLIIDLWFINKINNINKNIIYNYNFYKFYIVIDIIKNFIYKDLSIYIDLIKDRLYTFKKKSIYRLSAQTVLYNLLDLFLKWIFPILTFTSYESYKYINKKKYKNIFILKWNNINIEKKFNNIKILLKNNFWNYMFYIKNIINKIIEECKEKKKIKNSLEIIILLYIKKNKYYSFIMNMFINELNSFFITSKILILDNIGNICNYIYKYNNNDMYIYILKNNYIKCIRCWNFYDKSYYYIFNINNKLCLKCIKNMYLQFEESRYLL